MGHDLDRYFAGDFLGAAWLVLIGSLWFAWRLTPLYRARTAHVLRYLTMAVGVIGVFFPFSVGSRLIQAAAAILLAILAYNAVKGFPPPFVAAETEPLSIWARILRVSVKVLQLLLAGALFTLPLYLGLFAYFATPPLADFTLFADPMSGPQSKFSYLYFYLFPPAMVLLVVLLEMRRRPLAEDGLSAMQFYTRIVVTLVLMLLFVAGAVEHPMKAIRIANDTGYVSERQPIPCPPWFKQCPAAESYTLRP